MDDEIRARFDALDLSLNAVAEKVAQLGSSVGDQLEQQTGELQVVRSAFDSQQVQLDAAAGRFDALDRQLSAIVLRLEEQDASHDRLMAKVDRLSLKIDQLSTLARAGEEAMTSIDALSRRVARL